MKFRCGHTLAELEAVGAGGIDAVGRRSSLRDRS